MFKKSLSFVMAVVLTFSAIAISSSSVHASSDESQSTPDIIELIEPYVDVDEDGNIGFKDLPNGFYEKYNLEDLQDHFDHLNNLSQSGHVTINDNLDIQSNLPTPRTVYGSWTYKWWGYDRYFNNAQANSYKNTLLTAAAGATIVAGVSYPFPPVAGIATVQAGYWGLLATRVDANNRGRGVYVGVTWALVFNVEPL